MEANLGEQICQVRKSGPPRHLLADDGIALFGVQRSRARVALVFTWNRMVIADDAVVRDADWGLFGAARARGVGGTSIALCARLAAAPGLLLD